jgi:acyl-CoA synthetase (AMP-forming)/AMP-acid ligase II
VAVGGEVSTEALRDHLLARLAPWQVPRAWHVVERLEAHGRGKLSRAAWRERLGAA